MKTIHLLVEDDYIENFVEALPRDKVTIIEENFRVNQKMFQELAQNYKDNKTTLVPYYESMKDLNSLLKEKE